MVKKYYYLIFAIFIVIIIYSCGKKKAEVGDANILAVANNDTLFVNDLMKVIPDFTNKEDSAAFVTEFIENWVEDKLVYAEAKKNLTDTAIIVKKLEDFRQQLYIHYYKENSLFKSVKTEVTQTEIEDYYNKHLKDYVLATSYLKAHYMTMDAKVTTYSDEWETMKRSKPDDVKMLKDYCIGTSRKVYFIEDWKEIRNFLDIVNYSGEISEAEIKNNMFLDYINGGLRYMVKIDEFSAVGDYLPLELAKPEIVQIIINSRKKDKLQQLKNELLKTGIESGAVYIKKNN